MVTYHIVSIMPDMCSKDLTGCLIFNALTDALEVKHVWDIRLLQKSVLLQTDALMPSMCE